MKILAIIGSLLLIVIFAPSASFASETNAELNTVVCAIHADLLKLKSSHAWFSNYSESCLLELGGSSSIHYLPSAGSFSDIQGHALQQPEILVISYVSLNQTNAIMSFNAFQNVADCHFPSLKLKMYGHLNCEDADSAKLMETVSKIVERECAKLQKRKSD